MNILPNNSFLINNENKNNNLIESQNNINNNYNNNFNINFNNINNNPNNSFNVNLEKEITIQFNLSDKNSKNLNSSYDIKAKLNEKFVDVLHKLKDKNCTIEIQNYSTLIFTSNNNLIR